MDTKQDDRLAAEIDALAPPFVVDGTEHERGSDCWCRPTRRCRRCEVGNLHDQGIYGGIMSVCDACDAFV